MTATPPAPEEIRALIDSRLGLEGPLLPILHAMQEAFGHIPDSAVTPLAEALNLGRGLSGAGRGADGRGGAGGAGA